jgi:DNA ligase-1
MHHFANLLDRLSYTPGRLEKERLMVDYFQTTPDPDRGYALAALTGELTIPQVKSAQVKELIARHIDPELFRLSYDYVGDLSETVALLWPGSQYRSNRVLPVLSEIVERLQQAGKKEAPDLLSEWLDSADATERWALLKLVTGNLRIGVSARSARQALATFGKVGVEEIEECWHGLAPPYLSLFHWLEGKAEKPEAGHSLVFRPVMLAHPLEDEELEKVPLHEFFIEWKWDGIRIQLVGDGSHAALYSRTGDDIAAAFPDALEGLRFDGVLDGELLVKNAESGEIGSFNDLQQRLNRKSPTRKLMESFPAHLMLYDALFLSGEDLRPLPLTARRERLERWHREANDSRFSLSELLPVPDDTALKHLRSRAYPLPNPLIEGIMLKRFASPYLAGRVKGHWFKWKRDPHTIDAVMMYAQRGHGKRSSFYSDYTFGLWEGDTLLPVGKAYSGFTDEELKKLDKWVRDHTTNRFGPVREVTHNRETGMVLEVAFDSVQPSSRHKSGVAMRFPRIHRIRWDKPSAEADTLENLKRLIG